MMNLSLQDRLVLNVRTAAILTTSYVTANILNPNDSAVLYNCSKFNGYNLYVDFTKGSLTTAEIKIEFSEDGTNWYQESNNLISGGTNTVTVNENVLSITGAYMIKGTCDNKYIRISSKGTGTVTGSSLAIKITLLNRN